MTPTNDWSGDLSGEPANERIRLDLALVERELVETRSRARDFIKRSLVMVDGVVVTRPGQNVSSGAVLTLAEEAHHYVSRGGEKLKAALDHFSFEVDKIVALDIGASTGGFTEVLLERGAARVFAIDVGFDQLHERLQSDDRVVSYEEVDARQLDEALISEPVDAIVIDVSFISLIKALENPFRFLKPGGWLIALVKPQFEVGRKEMLGKGGIVRNDAIQDEAVTNVRDWIAGLDGWQVDDVIPSPLLGKAGNREFLLGARYGG